MTGRERLKQQWRRLRASLRSNRSSSGAGAVVAGEDAGRGCSGFFLLGAGRSGTSLLAAMLSTPGWHQGEVHSIRPREANPLGFFEDWEVNAINDRILGAALKAPGKAACSSEEASVDHPGTGQHWLARVPLGTPLEATADLKQDMVRLMQQQPFCYKDPRFSYTLDLWLEQMTPESRRQVRSICMFRRPEVVVESLLKEVRVEPTLHNLAISVKQAFAIWELSYRWILRHCRQPSAEPTLFLEYEALLSDEGQHTLEQFSGLRINRSLPRPELNRSGGSTLPRPPGCHQLYRQLRKLADADQAHWSVARQR